MRVPFRQQPLTFYARDDPPSRSQTPEFLEVQAAYTARHPLAVHEFKRIAIALAVERGDRGFTADDVRERAQALGLDGYEEHTPGIALGALRSHRAIRVMGREKGRSALGKGRWINRFKLNADAIEVPA